MIRVKLLICLLLCLPSAFTYAQDITNFTQFFINPYSINPSYAGIEGRSALFLAYRKQWATIDGGPTIGSLSFHTPTNMGLNYGVNISNDTRGILNNSGLMFTVGYTLNLDNHKFIRFGLSAGAAWNGVKEIVDPLDPALAKLLSKNASLLGNVGLSVHLKTFHFGTSLPNIFSPSYVSTDAFTVTKVDPFQAIIVHASNRFYFGRDKHVFEPYLLYRLNKDLPSQLEAAAVVHLNHTIWFGGSYKQDFGISALGGVKLQNFFLIGGSYSIKNTGVNELNSPTYEVQMSYIFGAKKKNIPLYSFVNTVKEKEKRKTPSQLAAEKRKVEEEKKKADVLAKKQQEDKRLADEAKKQQEEAARQAALVKKDTEPVKEPVIEPVLEPIIPVVKKHDGGPRLKSEVLAIDLPTYDTAHHEEKARITRLEEHAADPDEHHGDVNDTHPNAERHEFVKRGGHQEELEAGDFVVSGVFKSDLNANHFADGLKKLGFEADYGHLTEKNLWYVYISQSNDINTARADRDKFRKMKIFRDSWLLTVFH